MADLRDLVTFDTDFPDDSVEDESAILEPAGRNIAAALSGLLAEKAFNPTGVTQHEYYWWAFSTQHRPNYRFLLQGGEPWILLVEHQELIAPKQEDQLTMLRLLHELLSHDSRFHNIRWFTRKEFEKSMPGSNEPT